MVPPSDFPATCPGCQATYRVPLSMAGLLVTCETCQTDFVLPEEESAAPLSPSAVSAKGPKRHVFLKNALLLCSGAAAVWGVSLYIKRNHPAPETSGPVSSGPASQEDSAAENPPAPVFTSVTKRRPVPPGPATGSTTPPDAPVPGNAGATAPPVPSAAVPAETVPVPAPVPVATLPPASVAENPLPAAPPANQADAAGLRQDSRLTLERFLSARTLEERLAVSQNPGKIRQSMEEHYRTHPMGPLAPEEITFLTDGEVPDTNRKFHLYNVVLRDHDAPIPMAVEQTGDGYRVDWPTFAECYTHRLRGFFAAPSEEAGLFRVMLRRAHYFGPPVPGQDTDRIAYKVEPPGREDSFHVWVDKDSQVYREKLAKGERAGWDAESYVIVELLWRGDDTRGRWVSLRRIASDSWRAE